jgi:ubiquinone/menaquinone biosynthesis C-methylase UbiE
MSTAAIFERPGVHDHPADRPLKGSEAARIKATLDLFPTDARTMLDVGCGPGVLMHHAQQRFPQMASFGTDLGSVGLRQARQPVFRSSIDRLPFADASVDLVTCCEVLEHLPPTLVPAALAELSRVARKTVLITVPHAEHLLASSQKCPECGTVFHVHGHLQSLAADDLLPHLPQNASTRVEYVWQVRPWVPAFLHLRTHVLGAWKHSAHAQCPQCGNQQFENREGGWRWKLAGALNHIRHPRRTKGNWLLIRADLA